MVRKPYIDKKGLKRGAWSEEEDNKLRAYVLRYKAWNWNLLPRFAGLDRCGKSCRMRWENYLKPGVIRGGFSKDDEQLILKMQKEHGNKWSLIAKRMPGRTDNEIKNYWHTILSMRNKQDQNSFGIMENPIQTSEEELSGVDQTENASNDRSIENKEHNGNAAIADSLTEITFTEAAVEASKESNQVFGSESSEAYMSLDASHNQLLPTTNGYSPQLYVDELMLENCLNPTLDNVEEPLLVNSSNTEEAPTTYSSFTLTEDMILNLEENLNARLRCADMSMHVDVGGAFNESIDSSRAVNLEESFFAASESFNLESFVINENNSYSSSTSSDLCPRLMNFPSPSCNSWSPDEIFSASPTEPFSIDASNMPFLELETSTILGRLDSLESFGFWKALWNILN